MDMDATLSQDHTLFKDELTNLDRAIALENVGGDFELLQEVARLFLDDYPTAMANIRAAVEARDAKAVERTAHYLKGALANFGAEATIRAAEHLEQLGRSG